jgi:ATP-binding cassette, subfamily G (WHITE), member 1
VFIGPVFAVPIMLLSVYGIGSGKDDIPAFIRFMMSFSYLRYALEGIIQSIYGFDRDDMICPLNEPFCPFKKPIFLLKTMGFENLDMNVTIFALITFYVVFNTCAVMLVKKRLSPGGPSYWPVQFVSHVVKTYLNFTPYKV